VTFVCGFRGLTQCSVLEHSIMTVLRTSRLQSMYVILHTLGYHYGTTVLSYTLS